jgi:cell division septation protein DedD
VICEKNSTFALVIELQRHIEILLLNNDCVIVPGFGGFITHSIPARYEYRDNCFLPPLRTLGFNPQLQMNDSVLVQSYVEAYDLSYPEALRRIEGEVAELRQCLEDKGRYTLENLGELTINQDGNYEFSPCESGILSPELYGLGTVSFKTLKGGEIPQQQEILQQKQPQVITDEPVVSNEPRLIDFTDTSDSDSAIYIKMSWVRNAVAVAAAVVAFFFIATPVANSNLGTEAMTHLQHSLLYKLIPQDTTLPDVDSFVAKPVVEERTVARKELLETVKVQKTTKAGKTPEASEAKVAETSAKSTNTTTYCIIVASQVKLANAEQYVEKLKKEGYPNAYVLVSHNVVRVVSDEFSSEAEAYRTLNKMSMQEEFYEAWVYKKKPEV